VAVKLTSKVFIYINYWKFTKYFFNFLFHFVVLPPIDVSNTDVDQIDTLTNSTRELMLKTLKEITPPQLNK
jgi:hypothetical protein